MGLRKDLALFLFDLYNNPPLNDDLYKEYVKKRSKLVEWTKKNT